MTIRLEPATNPDAQQFEFPTASLGRPLQVYVSRPPFTATAETTAALYVLDGNSTFHTVAALATFLSWSGQMPPLVVVGIGYSLGPVLTDATINAEWRARRLDDLMFVDGSTPAEAGGASFEGRGDALLEAIADELIPAIEGEFALDPHERALIGHSAAGAFAIGALLERPNLFRRIVATSAGPRIDALSARFSTLANTWTSKPDQPRTLYLAHATTDIEGISKAHTENVELFERLGPERVRLQHEVIPDEDHYSVWPAAYVRGLRSVYA